MRYQASARSNDASVARGYPELPMPASRPDVGQMVPRVSPDAGSRGGPPLDRGPRVQFRVAPSIENRQQEQSE